MGKRIAAIKLVGEKKGLGVAAATAYVDAIATGGDPEQAAAATPAQVGVVGCAYLLVSGLVLLLLIGGVMDFTNPYFRWTDMFFFLPAEGPSVRPAAQPAFPESSSSYAEVDAQVGCKSTYSGDKQEDVFNNRYRDHWMTWSGTVELSSSGDVALDIDGIGFQDLQVDFADKRSGYALEKGSRVTVRFLMKRAGGCIFPFAGEEATIVRE